MSINLSGTSAAARAQQQRDRLFSRGILLSVGLLLIVAAAYGGLRVYAEKIRGDIIGVDTRIDLAEKAISSKETVRVVNALYRIEDSKKHEVPNSVELAVLEAISAAMVPSVQMKEYAYAYDNAKQETRVTVVAMTDDFTSIARQIDAIKKTGQFDNVAVENTERDTSTNKIRFSLTMTRASGETPTSAQ